MKTNKGRIRLLKYNILNTLVLVIYICSISLFKSQVLENNFENKNTLLKTYGENPSDRDSCSKEVAYRKLLYKRLSSKLKERKLIITNCSRLKEFKNEVDKISNSQNEVAETLSNLLKFKSSLKNQDIRIIQSSGQKISEYLDGMKNSLLSFHDEDEYTRIKNNFSDLSNKIYTQLLMLDIKLNQQFLSFFQEFLNNIFLKIQAMKFEKTSKIKSKNKTNMFSFITSFDLEIQKLFKNLLDFQKKALGVFQKSEGVFKDNMDIKFKEIISSSNINNSNCDYKTENDTAVLEDKLNKRREAWANLQAICEDLEKEKSLFSYNNANIKMKIKNK
jgi:hypothetical protein